MISGSDKKLVTVFTPTYNRAQLLERCYESLLKQHNKNFIWQVVDDGSIDETPALVESWISHSKINIEYIKKENGGKASAINRSLECVKTDLWLCLDSDDYLIPDAISIIENRYKEIEQNHNFCGLFSLRGNLFGEPMQGVSIPRSTDSVTQSEVRYFLKIPPEYAHVFKTSVIRDYKYPLVQGERYFPLSYIFDQIDQSFRYKVIHRCFMICEYQESGITLNKRKLIAKNPIGYMMYKRQLMMFAPSFKERCKAAANYVTACLLAKRYNPLKNSPNKLLTFFCIPLGVLDYIVRYRLNFNVRFE